MKKLSDNFVIILLCGALFLNMFQIKQLEREIDSLENSLYNEINNVNGRISNIYYNVEEILEEESNQLSIADWRYGNFDADKKEVEIICTVLPKSYNPQVTKAALTYNGKEVPLTYQDGHYTTTLQASLFAESYIEQVSLIDNGTIRTQALDWTIMPLHEVLLEHTSYLTGSCSYTSDKNGNFVLATKYSFFINLERKGDFQVKSVELVEVLDGKEISRTPIDISYEGQMAYATAAKKGNQAIPERIASVDENEFSNDTPASFDGTARFFYYAEKDYPVSKGSMLELYIDVVDGNDYRYRSLVSCYARDEKGKADEARMDELEMYIHVPNYLIFDKNGDVLYKWD